MLLLSVDVFCLVVTALFWTGFHHYSFLSPDGYVMYLNHPSAKHPSQGWPSTSLSSQPPRGPELSLSTISKPQFIPRKKQQAGKRSANSHNERRWKKPSWMALVPSFSCSQWKALVSLTWVSSEPPHLKSLPVFSRLRGVHVWWRPSR